MALSSNLGYQESISVHPTRRQIFAGKPYSTFPNIWEWVVSAHCFHNFEDFRGLAQFFFLVSMQTDKAQDMIDGVNGDSDLHRHQGVHRHWIVIVFHCCCCFDAGAASGQLFMHGLVTLPQHLFQNKSLTLSVTFNIIVKRLFLNFEQLQLMLSYEHWQSTTTANSKQISAFFSNSCEL